MKNFRRKICIFFPRISFRKMNFRVNFKIKINLMKIYHENLNFINNCLDKIKDKFLKETLFSASFLYKNTNKFE